MTVHFAEKIAKKQAITFIDDVKSKNQKRHVEKLGTLFPLLETIRTESCPNKTKLFLRNVQFLGHIVSYEGCQPVIKKVQDLKDFKSPENMIDVKRTLGSLIFCSTLLKKMHVDSKFFYEHLRDDVAFKRTRELKLCQNIKD